MSRKDYVTSRKYYDLSRKDRSMKDCKRSKMSFDMGTERIMI